MWLRVAGLAVEIVPARIICSVPCVCRCGLLTARARPSDRTSTLRQDEVWYVQFSNGGTQLATASKDKTVIIWNMAGSQVSPFRPSFCCTVTRVLHTLGGPLCHRRRRKPLRRTSPKSSTS